MTAVMADLHTPNKLYIAKGDRPLHLRYSERLKAAVWASEKRHLNRAGHVAAGEWDVIGGAAHDAGSSGDWPARDHLQVA